MHALFGLMPSTFGGRYAQFLEMIHAEDRQQVAREFAQALESRAEYDGEFRVVGQMAVFARSEQDQKCVVTSRESQCG
jgi:hypothetical protein